MTLTKLQKAYGRSRIPLYLQVAGVLRQRIETGIWSQGEKIPTIEKLEQEFRVARVTIRQAIDVLREAGLLYSHQGRGTFVALKTQDRRWLKLATDWRSLATLLKENVPRQITAATLASRPILSENDGLLAQDYVFLRSVQYKDRDAYGVVNLQLDRRVFALDPEAFKSSPALPILADLEEVDVATARQSITVGEADPETADLLQIALGAPVVHCRCVITDEKGVAIYGAEIRYRSDCVEIDIDLRPKSARRAPKTFKTPLLEVVRRPERSSA